MHLFFAMQKMVWHFAKYSAEIQTLSNYMFVLISSDHGLDTCFDYSKHFTSTHQLCFDSVITTSQGRGAT